MDATSYTVRACADCGQPVIDLKDDEGYVIATGHISPEHVEAVCHTLLNIAAACRQESVALH